MVTVEFAPPIASVEFPACIIALRALRVLTQRRTPLADNHFVLQVTGLVLRFHFCIASLSFINKRPTPGE